MLQDYYNTGDDNSYGVSAKHRKAQTFTPSESYQLQSVKLLLHRGTTYPDPGNITVRLYGTAAGVPSGSYLATVTQSSSGITDDTAGEWVEFTFASPVSVSSGIMYAIVVYCECSDAYALFWRLDVTEPEYTGGTVCTSWDSGESWAKRDSYDFMFETYNTESAYVDVGGGIVGLGGLSAGLRVGTPELVGGSLAGSTLLSGALAVYDSPPLAGGITAITDLSGALYIEANWIDEQYRSQHRLVAFGNNTIYYEVL